MMLPLMHWVGILFLGVTLSAQLLYAQAAPAKPFAAKGTLVLPAECVVFSPFKIVYPATLEFKDVAVPAMELLKSVPETLVVGSESVKGRKRAFDVNRGLNLADCFEAKGSQAANLQAYIFIPFAAEKTETVTLGFGADWWYEAYLDGQLISETTSNPAGNGTWPPSIHDFTVDTEVTRGNHVLVIRLIRGGASSVLAVGGPLDFPRVGKLVVAKETTDSKEVVETVLVKKAEFREGPPAEKKWKLAWQDEFDGNAVDEKKWLVITRPAWNWPGIATKEKKENCAVDGKGNLVLQLTRDADGTVRYGPDLITRSFARSYGYYETRVQFTKQPGWWTAVWLAGHPYDCGPDAFVNAQEFDIYEDFYKPKSENDVSHAYHCSVSAGTGIDTTRGGFGDMLHEKSICRVSHGRKVIVEEYAGWHTVGLQWTPLEHIFYVDGKETRRQSYRDVPVTTVPQHFWITSESRTPAKNEKPFYGRLEDAELPDELRVDYVRFYEEDYGDRKLPTVTLTRKGTGDAVAGKTEVFEVQANDPDGMLTNLYLFSMGRLRAECTVNGMSAKQEMTTDSLFPQFNNTVIAMARSGDGRIGLSAPITVTVRTGKENTGTAYLGKPQVIPGRIIPGHYDQGGNGVAYFTKRPSGKNADLSFRDNEIGGSTDANAIPAGGETVDWVTYHVTVKETGEYDATLMMNRPDYETQDFTGKPDDVIQLDVDMKAVALWKLPATWTSGPGWRVPMKSVGTGRIKLTAGEHLLTMQFKGLKRSYAHFGGLEIAKVGYSTAYRGKPQVIPGKIIPGYYDEGGNGVAYFAVAPGEKNADLPFRAGEIGRCADANAIPVGSDTVQWVSYHVVVKNSSDYDVELYINRPDYEKTVLKTVMTGKPDEVIELVDGKSKIAEWKLPATWDSGTSWRSPVKSIGRQRIRLNAGEHQLFMRFKGITISQTHFGGLDITQVKP